MECCICGEQLNETYFECLDNFLQVKYFDSEEENIFCSKKCFCESLSLTELEVPEEKMTNITYHEDPADIYHEEQILGKKEF